MILIILGLFATVFPQTEFKRSRGAGLYKCKSANTIGAGNIWAGFRALGFLWDSDPEDNNRPEPFAFPEFGAEVGIFNLASVYLESRVLTYSYKYDWLAIGSKFTFLRNKDIRFQNVGLLLEYKHRFLKEFHTSIAGFQNSEGTGFCPEGFIVKGGNLTVLALYDLDFLAKLSWLPLKLYANIGARIPFDKEFLDYSQYLIYLGAAYIGLGADVFIEYSIEAFGNTSADPKKFSFNWAGWGTTTKTWEVAFPENPMYLTLGGRIRYPNGIVLYGAIPLLISQNAGSAMTKVDREALSNSKFNPDGKFYDEWLRGITDPFDPWYAKWKIILQIFYPIRYRQTGAEMRRNFLLLKNRKEKKKIDIDERINLEQSESEEEKEKDRKKRLEAIKKRREEIEKSE